MNSIISWRLIAEVTDNDTAKNLLEIIESRIDAFGPVIQSNFMPYWKTSGQFELNISLKAKTEPELDYERILSSLGEGWDRQSNDIDEPWAVWNPKEGSKFFDPSVCWAYVGRFPESAIQSP